MMNAMGFIHNHIIDYNLKKGQDDCVQVSDAELHVQQEEQQELNPEETFSQEAAGESTAQEATDAGENYAEDGIDRLIAMMNADKHFELRAGLVKHIANN